MKINLGCGRRYNPNYVNVDVNKELKVDICAEVPPLPFKSESADEILAEHFIEHLFPNQISLMFKEFYRVLKPSGKAILEFPDLEKCLENIKNNWKYYVTGLRGVYGYEKQIFEVPQLHKWGFTKKSVVFYFRKYGFKGEIKCIDWSSHGLPQRDSRVIAVK